MTERGYKRIYLGAATGITTLLALFIILQGAGLEIIDLTGNIACEGTIESPCVSYFNIRNPTSKSIYIYNKEAISLAFSPDIKNYQLYVKYYGKWVPMNFTMETRLGNVPKDRLYTFVFPRYSTKEFKLVGYKKNNIDSIKWGIFNTYAELDPIWLSNYNVTEIGKRIIIQNANYTLEWELTETGTNPHRTDVHLFGHLISNFNKTIDFGIITPRQINSGNFYVEYEKDIVVKIPHIYFCDSPKYGWEIVGKEVWCNTTFIDVNGTRDFKDLEWISSEYAFKTNPNNATIYWNTSKITKEVVKRDLKSQVEIYHKPLSYGDNQYVVKDLQVKENTEYNFHIVLEIDESKLPLKYTVVIGDISESKIYFLYDPTITTARTWTTEDDFNNNTITINITTSADSIKLTV